MASLIADVLLDRLLGRWINLEGRKVDLRGGKITLKDIELREDAFDALALPVAVRGGHIGQIEIEVPWTKLKTESLVVKLHSPVLLLAPHSEGDWDDALESRRAKARKARSLESLRQVGRLPSAEPEDEQESGSFVSRLVERVLSNMQLLVTSAIVRFEDHTHSSSPFALEVAFDSLWIHPSHVTAPDASAAAAATAKKRPPFQQREALICALCMYVLQGRHVPPAPQRTPCRGKALLARVESTGLPVDTPVALRSNSHRCCVQPLSFAVELCTKLTFTPSLPQHVSPRAVTWRLHGARERASPSGYMAVTWRLHGGYMAHVSAPPRAPHTANACSRAKKSACSLLVGLRMQPSARARTHAPGRSPAHHGHAFRRLHAPAVTVTRAEATARQNDGVPRDGPRAAPPRPNACITPPQVACLETGRVQLHLAPMHASHPPQVACLETGRVHLHLAPYACTTPPTGGMPRDGPRAAPPRLL